MSKKVIVEGKTLIVPDDATPDEIDEISRQGSVPANSVAESPVTKNTPGPVARFASGVKRGLVDPLVHAGAAGAGYVLEHPVEAASAGVTMGIPQQLRGMKAMLEGAQGGAEEQFTKMFEQFDRGGLEDRGEDGAGLSTVGRAVAGAVPFVGPAAADVVERGAGGDVAGAGGELLGMLGGMEAGGRAAGLATKGARYLDAAKSASDLRASGFPGLGARLPTDEQVVNRALGVKPKHFKGGYQPTEGAKRTGIVDNIDQPTEVSLQRTEGKFDELGKKKKDMLASAGVAATGEDVRRAADILTPALKTAKETGNTALAKRLSATRKNLRTIAEGDLTAADLQKVIGRVDEMIESSTGSAGRRVKRLLFQVRKELEAKIDSAVPGIAPVNQDLRDLIPVKGALKEKQMRERASTGQGVPEPGPAPRMLGNLDPATILDVIQFLNSPGIGRFYAGGRLARRALRRK